MPELPDIPYRIHHEAIIEFMRYHGLSKQAEVAEIMGISAPYLCQLIKGARQLNEHIRLRIQLITRKSQDQLFVPNFDNALFSPQAWAMRKHYGVLPMLPPVGEDHDAQLEFGALSKPGNGGYRKFMERKKAVAWRRPGLD